MKHAYYVSCGDLHHYDTGEVLRLATRAEEKASCEAARTDGGAGVIGDSDLSRPVARRKLEQIALARLLASLARA